ncbi:MAG: helix-turn-helix domain-containing protein, partial [Acidimicrobiia bacterium]|nr:helix-turn-helix domain-containing protein [Acidimicrobiia bacterium]
RSLEPLCGASPAVNGGTEEYVCRPAARTSGCASVISRLAGFPTSVSASSKVGQRWPTRMLRELVLHIVDQGTLESRPPADERLARVLVDQLHPIEVTPLRLRIPTDSAGADVALRLRREPGADLDALARDAGVSRRTLERQFHEQTDMSLGRWRQRLQLMVAIELLASGASVSEAGWTVGYSSTSAFVTAFRRQMGITPGRYFNSEESAPTVFHAS